MKNKNTTRIGEYDLSEWEINILKIFTSYDNFPHYIPILAVDETNAIDYARAQRGLLEKELLRMDKYTRILHFTSDGTEFIKNNWSKIGDFWFREEETDE